MTDDLRQRLYEALAETFQNYTTYGARSSKKLLPLHRFMAGEIEKVWGPDYETHYLGENQREFKVEGKYYNKNVDIVTVRGGVAVFGLGIKFVTSNYSQNSNNYFENMMGETANIQRVDVPYAQALFLRDPMPYFKKGGELARYEKISAHHLRKYVQLAFDQPHPHQPFATCIHLVSVEETGHVKEAAFDYVTHGEAFTELYDRHFSIEALLQKVRDFKLVYEDTSSPNAFPWVR